MTRYNEILDLPISLAGDLWLLGEHGVLCGDATLPADVEHLMAGDTADLVFTDPPYNVDYEGYTEDKLKIQGDRMTAEQFQRFLQDTFRSYRAVVKPGGSIYVCHSSSWQREFQNAMEAAGFEVRCQIIWAKSSFAWGFGRYKFQHEPIFYAHVAGQKDPWYGDKLDRHFGYSPCAVLTASMTFITQVVTTSKRILQQQILAKGAR